ncbi:hypothetical protein N7523_002647 [Penicillium sp. IBT 18751x]|nr:hypothetical protein N7523_002647 [Penicillium sp. IBT 18751x]
MSEEKPNKGKAMWRDHRFDGLRCPRLGDIIGRLEFVVKNVEMYRRYILIFIAGADLDHIGADAVFLVHDD